ncbi:flagellar export protein FliJ [Marinobacter zhejiangensis]|uniref:Flagellar FliJ protein n=1 Tax=Marinobacter zhejiangensis TaxID=488535 RepID=A0A1I4NPF3_9GAMM|nr:flagellar export protein FliJ [Marinobacter zhejiangensis]SFM17033.1 flagellar FliJ protein [Marinobacter zhejiangensis]
MLRSKRLEVVLTLEERREKAALEKLAEARQGWERHRQRLDELRSYHADYREQIRRGQQGVVQVRQLQGWQAFIAQLDQVIAQAERQLEQAARVMEESRKVWLLAYERRRGMDKYIVRCREQEQRTQEAKEQKQLDDAASRMLTRRRP